MAPELDMGMGLEVGMGMGMGLMGMMGMEAAASSFSSAYVCGLHTSDAMRVDDLLDFSNQDDFFDAAPNVSAAENHQHHFLPMQQPSAAAGNLDTSSSNSGTFSDHLYVPSEEVAELEWLSKFVDDSFSDVPFPSSSEGVHSGEAAAASTNYTALRPDPSAAPARARSKRSRAPANALQHTLCTWSSPARRNSPSLSRSPTSPSSSSSELPPGGGGSSSKPKATVGFGGRKKEAGVESGVRSCTHCASEKTPQWRTGPLGPKTLCNACGVRYKSGRLVPEYRPAASPTFVLTQHSNSHRKVMGLRRQKELLLRHQGNASASAKTPPELFFGGYEAC